jgi:hypothetical protein
LLLGQPCRRSFCAWLRHFRAKQSTISLPLFAALYSTGNVVNDSKSSENIKQIKSDARKAIWMFAALNLSVILLVFIQSFDLVFAILFVQIALFIV